MKQDEGLNNRVRATRLRMGMSQQQLADAASVARQTVGGIEGGLYAASTTVALRLARALGCTVEELFWLEEEQPVVEAMLCESTAVDGNLMAGTSRAMAARVRGQWVAHPLDGERAFRSELIPADGLVTRMADGKCHIRLLGDLDSTARTILIAGCAPALSLWSRSAERWHPGLRVHWIHANSSDALAMLKRGEIHAAGLHLDAGGESANVSRVRVALGGESAALVNLGVWQEGLLVAARNPKGLRSPADLARPDVRIVNREEGAASRGLLERALSAAGITPANILGWETTVRSHEAVARAVASGAADAGMATESLAVLFGLDFIPVREVRYDMALRAQDLSEPHLRDLFSTLDHRWVRSQLRLLGGFDTSRTGDTISA